MFPRTAQLWQCHSLTNPVRRPYWKTTPKDLTSLGQYTSSTISTFAQHNEPEHKKNYPSNRFATDLGTNTLWLRPLKKQTSSLMDTRWVDHASLILIIIVTLMLTILKVIHIIIILIMVVATRWRKGRRLSRTGEFIMRPQSRQQLSWSALQPNMEWIKTIMDYGRSWRKARPRSQAAARLGGRMLARCGPIIKKINDNQW